MSNLVYLNGSYLPPEQATVPILDRGFMFGDGVYEVIPVYGGKPFRLLEHLQRLHNSLDAVQIGDPLQQTEWEAIFARLTDQNCDNKDAVLYLQVTRGVMAKRNHAYDRDMPPTVLVMCWAHEYTSQNPDTAGIRAIPTPMDMQGGCFSISSLGGIGGTQFTPIVNAPEVAILGVAKAKMQPVYQADGSFKPGLILPLALSYDHRVIDGAQGARFTHYLTQLLTDIRRVLL